MNKNQESVYSHTINTQQLDTHLYVYFCHCYWFSYFLFYFVVVASCVFLWISTSCPCLFLPNLKCMISFSLSWIHEQTHNLPISETASLHTELLSDNICSFFLGGFESDHFDFFFFFLNMIHFVKNKIFFPKNYYFFISKKRDYYYYCCCCCYYFKSQQMLSPSSSVCKDSTFKIWGFGIDPGVAEVQEISTEIAIFVFSFFFLGWRNLKKKKSDFFLYRFPFHVWNWYW